ncbi:substrate-binding domain-containing protein [Phytohabitans rumicis]|uniref:VWFA domain-containing protein n=1 Tax=Phytohabitans rumicis TaxID=1076125 RepID=A0A6V8LJ45_9ACTN|nr:substrate-binding domain-containing protein [Phytohabitans rumicis]GFJ92645.1 hypothetical protein Prum_062870 [Phytohabitans rumicis]
MRRSPVVWLSAVLVAILAGWAAVAYLTGRDDGGDCAAPVTVRVAAAPAIAEAVTEAAGAATDPCYRVEVSARDSAAVAAALAAPPSADAPHAWVPESSFWLRRAKAQGAFETPDRGTSVASTPVVVAMTEQVAGRFGWPGKAVPWSALLAPNAPNVPVGLPDPASDPLGVSAVIGIRALTSKAANAEATNVAALRRISPHTVTHGANLYQRLPGATDTGKTLTAFVTSEQAMLRHNRQAPETTLVPAYPDPSVPALDFPYVVLPGAGDAERQAATRFLTTLIAPPGQRILRTYDFKAPGDDALPDDDALVQLLTAWTGVHLSARLLGVLDVSGSMQEQVAGGGDTRMSATVRAVQQGLGLMLDTTEVGFWVFSSKLDGDRDYRVLARPQPLGEQRERLIAELAKVRAEPGGQTGLYDTTLAAYQDARRNWTAGRINVVVIFADGENNDPGSISRANLIAELTKLSDPRRPLPIIFIGIGGDIDQKGLTAIAKVTGAGCFSPRTPAGSARSSSPRWRS